MTVVLEGMSPAQEQGWLVLLDLFPNRRTDWNLIGGQMMYILAAENGVTMPRTTTDMDVVINVVESPGVITGASRGLRRCAVCRPAGPGRGRVDLEHRLVGRADGHLPCCQCPAGNHDEPYWKGSAADWGADRDATPAA